MRRFRRALLGSLCFVFPGLLGGTPSQDSAPQPTPVAAAPQPTPVEAGLPAAKFDVNDCKTCHEKQLTSFEHTKHMKLPGLCENCHGDVTNHLASETAKGEVGTIISFKKMAPSDVNKKCLTCHDRARQANWMGGVHDRKGLACTTCHSIHDFKSVQAQLKTTRDSQTCFSCHPAIRAKGMRTSHHPVREGKMDCASCHDPHDSTKPKMVSAEWVNEKCLTCHTEKRGPFLWEHAPVRENCLNCHDPHGSNHDKLLVAKLPFLCQRCHLNTRHPSTLYDFRNTIAGTNPSNRAVEHACKNCHQNIHGSNAPSGVYLGR
jgi:DmsE family decaheme c-type cytochrome